MKLNRFQKATSVIIATGTLLGLSPTVSSNDLTEIPKDSLYFTNGKFTVVESEKLPDYLLARNGIKNNLMNIAQIKNAVFIIPENGPQVQIHASGFLLLPLDRLKTGVNSRVNLMITPKIQMTLGEKTVVLFYQKQNKLFFKVESGNVRLSATELSLENKYFVETNEFLAEVCVGDFVASVSKSEGSTLFLNQGGIKAETHDHTSQAMTIEDIITKTKNADLKRGKINNFHKVYLEDELNFNFEVTNLALNLNDLVGCILLAPKDLLTRLSANSTDEKTIASLFDDIAKYIYQSKYMPFISRAEAQAVARIIISYSNNLSSLSLSDSAVGEGSRDDYLKELQNQMLRKADKLKELEEKLLREAEEAEAKAKAIK